MTNWEKGMLNKLCKIERYQKRCIQVIEKVTGTTIEEALKEWNKDTGE